MPRTATHTAQSSAAAAAVPAALLPRPDADAHAHAHAEVQHRISAFCHDDLDHVDDEHDPEDMIPHRVVATRSGISLPAVGEQHD